MTLVTADGRPRQWELPYPDKAAFSESTASCQACREGLCTLKRAWDTDCQPPAPTFTVLLLRSPNPLSWPDWGIGVGCSPEGSQGRNSLRTKSHPSCSLFAGQTQFLSDTREERAAWASWHLPQATCPPQGRGPCCCGRPAASSPWAQMGPGQDGDRWRQRQALTGCEQPFQKGKLRKMGNAEGGHL